MRLRPILRPIGTTSEGRSMKKPLRKNVLEAARDRIAYTFAEFDRVKEVVL